MVEPREFSHVGQILEVRAAQTTSGWSVRVFEDGQPVTRIFYTVNYETQMRAEYQGDDLVEALMRLAQEDIEADRVRLVDAGDSRSET